MLNTFSKEETNIRPSFNRWDFLALLLILGGFCVLAWGAKQMASPYELGEPIIIQLSPDHLAYYSLRTVLRMFIALIFSLLFTFVFGTMAAKNKTLGRLIIPAIDVMQSVPVLGFLSISVVGFIKLFPNNLLGPECAAIFAIFTSQVWNIALSFYQSLCTVPKNLHEVATVFQLSAWQKFWRVEVPFAMPGLLWNTMISMSAGWFFVVAAEAISVANQTITLPGIGSYIALAVSKGNSLAVFYAVIAMFLVILIYDQFLFRPLTGWAVKFSFQEIEEETSSWIVNFFHRTQLLRHVPVFLEKLTDVFINADFFRYQVKNKSIKINRSFKRSIQFCWYAALIVITSVVLYVSAQFIVLNVSWHEVQHVLLLGLITGLRIIILVMLCALVWVPIGVWIGLRPGWVSCVRPVIQFLAAFPANLLFPAFVILIIKYQLNVEVWTSPLFILGTQWYILFNVIVGASALPKDLYEAVGNMQVKGWLWWKRLALPGIFPYLLTGIITAAGGAWNASILAEAVNWAGVKLYATGLGAYIAIATDRGEFPELALGISVMCLYVLVVNRILWRPLYKLAEERYALK